MTLYEFLSQPVNPTLFNAISFTVGIVISFVLEGALGYAIYWKLTGEQPPIFGRVPFKKKKSDDNTAPDKTN